MARIRGVSATCSACGKVNLNEDQRIFRTKRRGPVILERVLKGLTAVFLISVTSVLLFSHSRHGGGIVIGFPILAAVLLWDTIGLVTRRRSVFRMEVLWPAMIACIGLGPAFVVIVLDAGINGQFDPKVIGPLIVWAAPWVAIGLGIRHLLNKRKPGRVGEDTASMG